MSITTTDHQRVDRLLVSVLAQDRQAYRETKNEIAVAGEEATSHLIDLAITNLAGYMQVVHGDGAIEQVRRHLLDLAAHE
ncbi:hypothetical protein AB0F44_01095 [Nocardioides sp. NPDC023903]|uniref:hypothetical protein n=1 Tax=Nocardioides sp. NPDC023903 TaxID=3157195 RepID=UPI0033DA5DEA